MTVTVAIPFFNAMPYMDQAIRSVFGQDFQDWELLLIDDGSRDGSLDLARRVTDSRVRVICDGRRLGLAARLNQVTHASSRPFIARMDADDFMAPERLSRQVKVLQDSPLVDVTSTGLYSVNSDDSLVGQRGMEFESVHLDDLRSGRVGIVHAAVMARRDWHVRNPYREDLKRIEDMELWWRTSSQGDLNVLSIADPLYVYREDLNISRQKLVMAARQSREFMTPYFPSPIKLFRHRFACDFKIATTIFLDTFGGLSTVQNHRNPGTLTDEARHDYERIRCHVNGTRVPGLDD